MKPIEFVILILFVLIFIGGIFYGTSEDVWDAGTSQAWKNK